MNGSGPWREVSSPASLSTRSKWRVRCDPRRSRTVSVLAKLPRRSPMRLAGRSNGYVGARVGSWPSGSSGLRKHSGRRCGAASWARARLAAPHRRPLCFLSPELPLGQDPTLAPTYPFDRPASRIGDLLGSFASTDTVLDLLGSQRTLHFDLVLSEAGELTSRHGPEPFIDGQRETPATTGNHENRVAAVLAHCDESQLLHPRPFRAVLSRCPFMAARNPGRVLSRTRV